MDEIQKVLVKAGRKDLAQLYYIKAANTEKEFANLIKQCKTFDDMSDVKKRINYNPDNYDENGILRKTMRSVGKKLGDDLVDLFSDYVKKAKYPADFNTSQYSEHPRMAKDPKVGWVFDGKHKLSELRYEQLVGEKIILKALDKIEAQLVKEFTPVFKQLVSWASKQGTVEKESIESDSLHFFVGQYYIAIEWGGYSESQGYGYTFAVTNREKAPYTYKNRAYYCKVYMSTSSLITDVKKFMAKPMLFVKNFKVTDVTVKKPVVKLEDLLKKMERTIGHEQLSDIINTGVSAKNKKLLIQALIENAYNQEYGGGLSESDEKILEKKITQIATQFVNSTL